jgi:hypothetical protein
MDVNEEKVGAWRTIGRFFPRWQEFMVAMPIVFVVALVIWIVLGSLSAENDNIQWLIELPIKCVYALAALGLTYLGWRRWSMRISGKRLEDYWDRMMAGERGPLIVFGINAGFYLCALYLFLRFLQR